jgi:isoquinoline 1-oxidoreductase alpha subunit
MPALNINGTSTTLDIPDDMPLLWAIRDVMGLTGTKFGCGVALCGACTVHLDGQAVRSCVTPVSAAVGKKITTIEAIGNDPVGARVQDAWRQIDVVQCGYCQSGQIMSATALLHAKPRPERCRHRRRHVGQYLPLRHLQPHPPRHQDRRLTFIFEKDKNNGQDEQIGVTAPPQSHKSRRGRRRRLVFGFSLFGCKKEGDRKEKPSESAVGQAATSVSNQPAGLAHDAFIRIDREGIVTLIVHKVEMGQGTFTSMPMLLAEELGADLSKVKLEQAPADNTLYADPMLGGQVTGGSTSVRGGLEAAARSRRQGAHGAGAGRGRTVEGRWAKSRWWPAPSATRGRAARTIHFGELVDAASKLNFPATVKLKEAADFTLIGKPLKRLDSAGQDQRLRRCSASMRACRTWASRRWPLLPSRAARSLRGRRKEGDGRQRRAPGAADRGRGGGRGRQFLGRQAGPIGGRAALRRRRQRQRQHALRSRPTC